MFVIRPPGRARGVRLDGNRDVAGDRERERKRDIGTDARIFSEPVDVVLRLTPQATDEWSAEVTRVQLGSRLRRLVGSNEFPRRQIPHC